MSFKYTSVSRVGLQRKENEDCIGVYKVEGGLLTIVCDGLGGKNAGEIASQITRDSILSNFKTLPIDDYLDRIKKSIILANKEVFDNSENKNEYKGMATTVEVLYIKENNAYWGHVGDSRIYNYKNGRLKQLTKDHSLVQRLIDDGYLTLNEAETHPNRHIITRALGENDSIDIDLSKIRIDHSSDNLFFVCTDGVSGEIRDWELETVLSGKDINKIAKKLENIIEERGARDNFSFVIITTNLK